MKTVLDVLISYLYHVSRCPQVQSLGSLAWLAVTWRITFNAVNGRTLMILWTLRSTISGIGRPMTLVSAKSCHIYGTGQHIKPPYCLTDSSVTEFLNKTKPFPKDLLPTRHNFITKSEVHVTWSTFVASSAKLFDDYFVCTHGPMTSAVNSERTVCNCLSSAVKISLWSRSNTTIPF